MLLCKMTLRRLPQGKFLVQHVAEVDTKDVPPDSWIDAPPDSWIDAPSDSWIDCRKKRS